MNYAKSELLGLSEYYKELLSKYVQSYSFVKVGIKTTVCLVTLKNGFEVVGTSSSVRPSDYDYDIGNRCSLKDALVKCDPLIGVLKQEALSEVKTL